MFPDEDRIPHEGVEGIHPCCTGFSERIAVVAPITNVVDRLEVLVGLQFTYYHERVRYHKEAVDLLT